MSRLQFESFAQSSRIRRTSSMFLEMTFKCFPIIRLNSHFYWTDKISVTFINRLMHSIITVVDIKILLYTSLKDTLKITPTCFGSHRIHHQGVITCTWLKLHIMVQMCLLCAWSVFGGIFWTCRMCVCVWVCARARARCTFEPLYVISVKYRLYHSLMMDPMWSETCWCNF